MCRPRPPTPSPLALQRLQSLAFMRAGKPTGKNRKVIDSGAAGGRVGGMHWLTPTDGLPDLERPVFLHLPDGRIIIGCRTLMDGMVFWANCYNSMDHTPGAGWTSWRAEADDDYTPTHWMGLPAGPNKKDQPRAGEMPHGSSAELS